MVARGNRAIAPASFVITAAVRHPQARRPNAHRRQRKGAAGTATAPPFLGTRYTHTSRIAHSRKIALRRAASGSARAAPAAAPLASTT